MHTRKISKQACQREPLILALLQQPSVEKAATSIGIYTVTAWRIWKTAEFKAGYRKARGEAYSQPWPGCSPPARQSPLGLR